MTQKYKENGQDFSIILILAVTSNDPFIKSVLICVVQLLKETPSNDYDHIEQQDGHNSHIVQIGLPCQTKFGPRHERALMVKMLRKGKAQITSENRQRQHFPLVLRSHLYVFGLQWNWKKHTELNYIQVSTSVIHGADVKLHW